MVMGGGDAVDSATARSQRVASRNVTCTEEISLALERACHQGLLARCDDFDITKSADLLQNPVAVFYDLNAWESNLHHCLDVFGEGCQHTIAMKSNSISNLMQRARDIGFGMECASVGEVLHAQALGVANEKIIYNSPCKRNREIVYMLKGGIHLNIENFEELRRVVELREQLPESTSNIGIRINPESGEGSIAHLSSVGAESKFGIAIRHADRIAAAFAEHPWLNMLHCHIGSSNMGTDSIVSGAKSVVDLALRINKEIGRRQLTVLDFGGGLPVDYSSDTLPDFEGYAAHLRSEIPGLLSDGANGERLFDQVITEFGQSLNAKAGFLASRVEYVKKTADGDAQVPVLHFGADVAMRQCYTKDHERRLEFFDGESYKPCSGETMTTNVAGPLCFQGDMLAQSLQVQKLKVDDLVVQRDAGANTLSLFSRHCSRIVPQVVGYRVASNAAGEKEVTELKVIKEGETIESLCDFWGTEAPESVSKVCKK